ncbi:MAG: SMC-Scp complex subunit ScpB [Candidatus Bathyarchaeia archaeon]
MATETNDGPELSEEEKMKEDLTMLEAALYVSGRPLDLKTLGFVINTRSKKKVQRLMRVLIEEYAFRNRALEILELENQRFVLQLKPKYSSKVRRLAIRPLLTDGPLKTLSYIAYRQPVTQKQVIDVRGRHSYMHIKHLIDMGLVKSERSGKANLLKTTDYFADFFGLSQNVQKMKKQLKKIFENETDKESLVLKEQTNSKE